MRIKMPRALLSVFPVVVSYCAAATKPSNDLSQDLLDDSLVLRVDDGLATMSGARFQTLETVRLESIHTTVDRDIVHTK